MVLAGLQSAKPVDLVARCRWEGKKGARPLFCIQSLMNFSDSSRLIVIGWRTRRMNQGSARCMCGRFPRGEGQWKVSLAGGERGDGKEIFFVSADGKMMAVPVKATTGAPPSFEAGAPQPLFDAHLAPSPVNDVFEYDVAADGKRFLLATIGLDIRAPAPSLNVIVNWDAGLKK